MTATFSRQAKAIAAFLVTFLVQLQAYVGQGGVDTLQSVTVGQWISIAILTASAYGVVYAVPNVTVTPEPPVLLPFLADQIVPPTVTVTPPFPAEPAVAVTEAPVVVAAPPV